MIKLLDPQEQQILDQTIKKLKLKKIKKKKKKTELLPLPVKVKMFLIIEKGGPKSRNLESEWL